MCVTFNTAVSLYFHLLIICGKAITFQEMDLFLSSGENPILVGTIEGANPKPWSTARSRNTVVLS